MENLILEYDKETEKDFLNQKSSSQLVNLQESIDQHDQFGVETAELILEILKERKVINFKKILLENNQISKQEAESLTDHELIEVFKGWQEEMESINPCYHP